MIPYIKMKKLFLIFISLLGGLTVFSQAAFDPENLLKPGAASSTLVTDYSGTLTADQRRALENKLVAYDATLQGGLFNRGSPYVLTSPQVRRNIMRADVGVVLDMGRWALEATRTYVSREFIGGLSHQWVELSFIRRF